MNLYSFSEVNLKYANNRYALKDLNIDIEQGEFVFIAGASGAGKSSLMKLMYGALTETEGELTFLNKKFSKYKASLRREMGIVFQDYKLIKNLSLIDNISLSLEIKGINKAKRKIMASEFLNSLGLSDRADEYPDNLSGGEQQRVAIGRAMVHKPKVLLADEPTGNLDPKMSRAVFDMLLEAHANGMTVIVATHDVAMIEALNLRTLVLDQGMLVGDYVRSQRVQ